MNPLRIIVVTGMSGSGKSTASHALEDAGFFCIDNLPPTLFGRLTELLVQSGGEIARLALVVDSREGSFLKDLPATLDRLRREGCKVEVLFLDASDEVLARRFTETRRRHPLSVAGSAEDGIRRERGLLVGIRAMSDRIIDSTELNVHQLKKAVEEFTGETHLSGRINISVISFGFKYGLPSMADLVFDARFLPNPYFIPKFKGMKGTEPSVAEFVLQSAEAAEFLELLMRLLQFQIPLFEAEGKVYLNVAIGCTGGQHRSVAIAGEITRRLAAAGLRPHAGTGILTGDERTGGKMIGVVLVGHGRFGAEMKATVESIVGSFDSTVAVSLEPHEKMECMREKIRHAIEGVEGGDGVLVLTDMFGGTPANLSLPFMETGKVEVITGFNLPMLIKLATCRGEKRGIAEVASFICSYGQRNISVAGELLQSRKEVKR
ncbi:MAG: RNase adapter RapZ [Myxococcota bacterium]|jgi:UPF0042 nucleotide-binding protein